MTYALENDLKILSNDRFTEYDFISEEWLVEHQIKFMIIQNHLIFQEPVSNLFKAEMEIQNDIDVQDTAKIKGKMEG